MGENGGGTRLFENELVRSSLGKNFYTGLEQNIDCASLGGSFGGGLSVLTKVDGWVATLVGCGVFGLYC